jgi:hypothetical protein
MIKRKTHKTTGFLDGLPRPKHAGPTVDPRLLMLDNDSVNNQDSRPQCRLSPCKHRHTDRSGTRLSHNTRQHIYRGGTQLRKHHAFRARYRWPPNVLDTRTTCDAHDNTTLGISATMMVRLEVTLDGLACIVVDKSRRAAWHRSHLHRDVAGCGGGV